MAKNISKLYHVNFDNEPGPCGAKKGGCPFGESSHFDSMEDAQKEGFKREEKNNQDNIFGGTTNRSESIGRKTMMDEMEPPIRARYRSQVKKQEQLQKQLDNASADADTTALQQEIDGYNTRIKEYEDGIKDQLKQELKYAREDYNDQAIVDIENKLNDMNKTNEFEDKKENKIKPQKIAKSTRTVLPNGTIMYRNAEGKLHREDGPAVEHPDGSKNSKKWYRHGELHREDGPAVEHPDGSKKWYRHGQRHREDGPAFEADGIKAWWVNGNLHREDGPAIEYADGDKEWWVNGNLHREDGPAVEYANGTKRWYRHGELHREDGPAVEYSNGTKRWYLHGNLHREDGPAIEYSNGIKMWCLNGKRHREDGPAVEYPNGDKDWWVNDSELTEDEFSARFSAHGTTKKKETPKKNG